MIRRRPAAFSAAVSAFFAMSLPASGADIGWAAYVGGNHTDNATRAESGGVSDTLVRATLAGAVREDTRRLKAEILASGTYLDYLDNTYDEDFLAEGSVDVTVGIVPERFLWAIEDRLVQLAIDEFQPVTPENRQRANSLSTGPDLIFRLGSRSEVHVSGRFGDTRYEETDRADDQRYKGQVTWLRTVSRSTTWGAAASHERIEYDQPGDPSYEQQELFATLHATGVRQRVRLDLGATRVESDDDSFTNPLLRINLWRQLRPALSLSVEGGVLHRNTGDRFVQESRPVDTSTGRVVITNTPAEAAFAQAALTFERPRTRFNFGAGFSRESDVYDREFDERRRHASAGFSRRLRPTLNGVISGYYEDREIQSLVGGSDETRAVSAWLDWRAGRSHYVTFGYRREERDSDIPGANYDDNVVFLTFGYRHGLLSDAPTPVSSAF